MTESERHTYIERERERERERRLYFLQEVCDGGEKKDVEEREREGGGERQSGGGQIMQNLGIKCICDGEREWD